MTAAMESPTAVDTRWRVPPIISLDDHLVEPPDLWQRWLPRRWRDQGPKVVRSPSAPNGERLHGDRRSQPFVMASSGALADFWVYEDLAWPMQAGFASSGLDLASIGLGALTFDQIRPGCHQVADRLADMTVNGVERSLCFPTFPRFCGQTFLEARDRDLALACVHAYNDFVVEEWCGQSGGRLLPLAIIPLWDPVLAAREIHRNANRGVRAVAFSELPANLGLPSIHDADGYWDPVFAACDDTGTVICIHIGSGSKRLSTSDDAPAAVMLALLGLNARLSLTDWLLSDVLERFPRLTLMYSEAQIGWMPYAVEQADRIWAKPPAVTGLPSTSTPPSERFVGRVFGCFFEDDFGVRVRHEVGLDQITFESDYPHQDSTWPNTRAYAERVMADLSDEEVHAIARGNAIRLLGLPEDLPATETSPPSAAPV